jgi:hypothetical protein
MIFEITKHFKGGSWKKYAVCPDGTELTKDQWEEQFEYWGERTDGGHSEGYRMYANLVETCPEGPWLEFSEDILPKIGDGKAKVVRSNSTQGQAPASAVVTAAKPRRARLGSGTPKPINAKASKTMRTVPTRAASTAKSLPAKRKNGLVHQPSVQAVVPPSTAIERDFLPLDPNYSTLVALGAIIIGMLRLQTDGNCIWLAMNMAQRMAKDFGVPQDEFERVKATIVSKWKNIGATDPIRAALGTDYPE